MSIACIFILFLQEKYIYNFRGGINSECALGHSGTMCAVCIYNENLKLYKISDNTCTECQSFLINILIMIALLVIIGVFLVLLIKYTII